MLMRQESIFVCVSTSKVPQAVLSSTQNPQNQQEDIINQPTKNTQLFINGHAGSGVPGRVRTCNLRLRRASRYPVVPRGHICGIVTPAPNTATWQQPVSSDNAQKTYQAPKRRLILTTASTAASSKASENKSPKDCPGPLLRIATRL